MAYCNDESTYLLLFTWRYGFLALSSNRPSHSFNAVKCFTSSTSIDSARFRSAIVSTSDSGLPRWHRTPSGSLFCTCALIDRAFYAKLLIRTNDHQHLDESHRSYIYCSSALYCIERNLTTFTTSSCQPHDAAISTP